MIIREENLCVARDRLLHMTLFLPRLRGSDLRDTILPDPLPGDTQHNSAILMIRSGNTTARAPIDHELDG